MEFMANIALITAGGVGSRMGQDIPKQFLHIYDKPAIIWTLEAFQNHASIDAILAVCLEGWEQVLRSYIRQFNITKLQYIVPGGRTGQESICNGLFELERHFDGDSIVLIHDGNRVNVSSDIISDCIVKVRQYGNAISCIPCAEAIMETEDGVTSATLLPRERLRRTQTPHGFLLKDICQTYREAMEKGITDSVASCALMARLGKQIYFSSGSEKNIKLTTVEDIDIFKALLNATRSDWLKGRER